MSPLSQCCPYLSACNLSLDRPMRSSQSTKSLPQNTLVFCFRCPLDQISDVLFVIEREERDHSRVPPVVRFVNCFLPERPVSFKWRGNCLLNTVQNGLSNCFSSSPKTTRTKTLWPKFNVSSRATWHRSPSTPPSPTSRHTRRCPGTIFFFSLWNTKILEFIVVQLWQRGLQINYANW